VSHVIPALIKKCVEAKETRAHEIEVWGSGSATREFLYVDDAAEGVLAALERYDDEQPLNLGSNQEIAIKELVQMICELVGYDGALRWDTGKPDGQPRRGVDGSRARRLIGFEPRVGLREGLRRTIDWYLDHRAEAESAVR
jgi:GDP-L-fucose synthase